jgi:hypothetical protein
MLWTFSFSMMRPRWASTVYTLRFKRDGDLFVRFALGEHLENFALAAAEQVDGVGDVLAVIVEDGVRNGRTEVAFAAGHGAYRGHQIVGHGIFQQIAAGAGAQDLAHVDRVLVHAQGDHANVRIVGREAAGGFDAVELRHGDIHDDDIGPQAGGEFDGFAAVAGFAHNFEVGLGAQNHAEALPHYGVIVS